MPPPTAPVAREFGIGFGELHPECRRLGMDAVAAPDGDGVLVLEGAALEGGQQRVDVGQQDVGGALQLYRERGVEDVRAGHALVHEACVWPDDFREMGQKGDDVVLGGALDLIDARDIEAIVAALGLAGVHHLPDLVGALLGDDAELGQLGRSHGLRSRTRCKPGSRQTSWRPFRDESSAGS